MVAAGALPSAILTRSSSLQSLKLEFGSLIQAGDIMFGFSDKHSSVVVGRGRIKQENFYERRGSRGVDGYKVSLRLRTREGEGTLVSAFYEDVRFVGHFEFLAERARDLIQKDRILPKFVSDVYVGIERRLKQSAHDSHGH